MKRFNVFVTENFEIDGEQRSSNTLVGNAVPHTKGEGFNIYITPGISVNGRLSAFPVKDKDSEQPG